MTTPARPPWRERAERLYLSFFAAPTDGSGAAILRMTLGLVAVWQAIGIVWNLHRFYSDTGVIPTAVVQYDRFLWLTPFYWAPKSAAVVDLVGGAFALASVALLVGFKPRVAALVLAYTHAALQFRNPFILNSGDRLFMIQVFLAAFAPLGHKWSVDAWLRGRSGALAPAATMWGQRLVGLQIAYVYIASTVAKVANERWRNGMALRDVLASPVFAEWPVYADFRPLIYFLTYMTLALELLFPFGVWFKRLRPWFILWGISFHVGIDVTMIIPIFSSIMIASYAAYLSDDEVRWVLARLRDPRLLLRRTPKGSAKQGAQPA